MNSPLIITIRTFAPIILLATFLTSCFKSESGCHEVPLTGALISLSYHHSGEGLLSESASTVDLYLFDVDSVMVLHTRLFPDGTEESCRKLINLPAGNYLAVAWVGAESPDYRISYEEPVRGALFTGFTVEVLGADNAGGYIYDSLYFGTSAFEVKEGRVTDVAIVVNTNTKEVLLEIRGIHDQDFDLVQVKITGGRTKYFFDNSMKGPDTLLYLPHSSTTGGDNTYKAHFSIQRLIEGDAVTLITKQEGYIPPVFELRLTEWIKNLYGGNELQEFLDREEKFHIVLEVTRGEDGIYVVSRVTVNEWDQIIHPSAGI